MGYAQTKSSQKRLLGFCMVLLLHVVLIYALVTGLAKDFVKKIANEPLEVNIIEEVKLPPPPPPPPPPEKTQEVKPTEVKPPPAYVPPEEVKVQSSNSQDTITAVVSNEPPPSAPVVAPAVEPAPTPEPPPPPKPKVKVKATLKEGCARPSYPAESIEMEEEGQVTLGFQIDVDGHVVESKIIKSSGFARLDDAAREAFGKCEFNPATVDGVPEKSLATVPFEWKIK